MLQVHDLNMYISVHSCYDINGITAA